MSVSAANGDLLDGTDMRLPSLCVLLRNVVLGLALLDAGMLAAAAPTVLPILFAGTPAPAAPPPPVIARAGGLTLSMALPTGPYFVGELLPVALALTNGSAQPVGVFGSPTPNACGAAFDAVATGGGPPTFTLSPVTAHTCPGGPITTVLPGQTLTVQQLLRCRLAALSRWPPRRSS